MFRKKQKDVPKLPPTAPPRQREQIQQEYANTCAAIGDKSMRIQHLNSEIIQLQAKCRQLNDEVNALPKEEVPNEQPSGPQ